MSQHLDATRKERVKHFIGQLSAGAPLEQVRAAFKKEFADVPAQEIADAERMLMEEGMQLEEVQQLCDVHAALFEGAVQEGTDAALPAGHPLFIFSQENVGLRRFIDGTLLPARDAYLNDHDAGRDALVNALHGLYKVDKHYSRKENLFFPYLEKAGVTAPPKVMWGVDDEIRDLIKQIRAAAEGRRDQEVKDVFPVMLDKLTSMITKEEEILKPLLLQHLDDAAWRTVAQESNQIGYAFADAIEGASMSDANAWLREGVSAPQPRPDAAIQLPSGFFTTPELTALLNALPCDITFVAADDTVHFFSEQENRIFPRTRTIIGRRVEDCHPPKSLAAVDALVQAFKDGKKDTESYWIQRGGAFILIRYFAVRDPEGNYLGVLECSEEISELRALEGQKTLMS